MLSKIDALWSNIVPIPVLEEEKLNPSWAERFIDHYLMHSSKTNAVVIILSILNTPGLIWRTRFFIETAFPGPIYLKHYFGLAPGRF
jgi:hypothetical protein